MDIRQGVFTLVVFCLIISATSWGSSFENEYNHRSGREIKGLQICGERCSGTNFVMQLLKRNFPVFQNVPFAGFGHKHFLWWFEDPIDEDKIRRLNYNMKAATLEDSEDCLFIVIVRDPYDWLRSFFLKPHHVSSNLTTKGFFHFISREWSCIDGVAAEIDNYNPYTRKPFRNVLELRKYKAINYLKLAELVDNFCLVRYEDVARNPEQFINFISLFYGLEKDQNFFPVRHYKGHDHGPIYVKNNYFPLRGRLLYYINRNLDWKVEKELGYSLKREIPIF